MQRASQERSFLSEKASQCGQPAPSRADWACSTPRQMTHISWNIWQGGTHLLNTLSILALRCNRQTVLLNTTKADDTLYGHPFYSASRQVPSRQARQVTSSIRVQYRLACLHMCFRHQSRVPTVSWHNDAALSSLKGNCTFNSILQ